MLRKKAIVAVCGALLFAVTGYAQDTSIRPSKVNVSEESLADLRRRIAATRWPDRETVADQSQGVQLATIQELARYWAEDAFDVVIPSLLGYGISGKPTGTGWDPTTSRGPGQS